MNEYHRDIFYSTKHLSLEEMEALCRDGLEKSYEWWIDELLTAQRQKIEVGFDEMMLKLRENDKFQHFVVINRKGYEEWKDPDCFWNKHNWCMEIALIIGIYYLWIYLDVKELPHFIEKYKLTLL